MIYKEIIDKMTLEQKASLMSGKDFWQTQDIPDLNVPSMFLADGPHGIRKQALSADHLGLNESIPATCFPTAATMANSWNLEMAVELGEALGEEAANQNVNVLLGPGINIKRNPLCGRNFEYFSEDPYLAGKIAASYIKGIQSKGVSACVKHFAVNNQEKSRMTIDSVVDERTLREIYLTAFEIAVKEGDVGSVMSSYNKLNGIYTNENQHLLKEILRDEWGFNGCVISDWGGSNDRVEGLKAGNELEMPTTGGETNQDIINAVKSGNLNESVLDEAVDRLLHLAHKTNKALETRESVDNLDKNHLIAQKAAEESIVLLKNENSILPLDSNKSIAIIGDFADQPRYQGAGSSIVNPTKLDSFLETIKESGLINKGFAKGYKRYGGSSSSLKKEACKLAKEADTVLLFIGLDEFTEVEGLDRENMSLPVNQIELLNALYEVNKNIVVILSSGSAIEIPWIDKTEAIVHGYLGGQAGAGAIFNILIGKVNPSGKLAETYPYHYEDISSSKNFPGNELSVEYREGLFVGYRYFSSVKKDVLFPFGFGLSYTNFNYSDLNINSDSISFKIKNTGSRSGAEVAQLYVGLKSEEIIRPAIELKGFIKIDLFPGELKEVTIPFDDKTFRYFNVETGKWEIESGEYTLYVGASSADFKLQGTTTIKGSDAPSPYKKELLESYFTGDPKTVGVREFETLLGHDVPEANWDRKRDFGYNDTVGQCFYAKGGFARFAYRLIVFAHGFLGKIGRRDLSNLIMMSVYHMPFRGLSRMTGGIINIPMLDGILLIVNGHFFKGLNKVLKENRALKKSKRG